MKSARHVESGLRSRIRVLERQLSEAHNRIMKLSLEVLERQRSLRDIRVEAFNQGVAAQLKIQELSK